MKRMICCLMAIMGVLTLSAQSTNDFKTNPVLDNIMARHSVRKYLDIPAGYKLLYIIAIGYADEQPEAKPRDTSKIKYIK